MKIRIGLVGRLLTGIAVGILPGAFAPEPVNRIVVTASALFSLFLRFVIPLMILAFVTTGIADLGRDAGRILSPWGSLSPSSTWFLPVMFRRSPGLPASAP